MSTEKCSFALEHYREILQTAKSAGYEFLTFQESQKASVEKCCILRHDIDHTAERATEFGRIEANLGIRSTFFFQIVASWYNTREQTCYGTVQELAGLGHQIALHFDPNWRTDAPWEDMPRMCADDRDLLAHLTNLDIPDIVSFHRPHTYADQVVGKDVAGIHHTYEPRYFSAFKYLSDSQGWYEGCVCKLFESGKYPRIQLLTHPYIWWEHPASDFIEDMAALINMRSDQFTEDLIATHPVCAKHQDRLRKLVSLS